MHLEMTNTPLVGVEVVLAVADILREAEWDTLISQKEDTEGDIGKVECLGAQVGECLVVCERDIGEGIEFDIFGHTEAMLWCDTFASFFGQPKSSRYTREEGGQVVDQFAVLDGVCCCESFGESYSPSVGVLQP